MAPASLTSESSSVLTDDEGEFQDASATLTSTTSTESIKNGGTEIKTNGEDEKVVGLGVGVEEGKDGKLSKSQLRKNNKQNKKAGATTGTVDSSTSNGSSDKGVAVPEEEGNLTPKSAISKSLDNSSSTPASDNSTEEPEETVTTPQPQVDASTFEFPATSTASDTDDGTFTSSIDENGNESYGLTSPDLKSSESTFPHQQHASLPVGGTKREGKQSIAQSIWRNSIHEGLEKITLEEDLGTSEGNQGTVGAKPKIASPKMGGSESESGEGEGEEEEDSYQFLLQRLDAQNAAIQTDQKSKRVSVQPSNTKMRASFDRLQKESEEEAGLIDWAFWGAVMSNYEEVATDQPRELSRAIQQGIPSALRGMTWQLMSASKDLDLEYTYSALLKQTSPHEKNIRRDLSRTYPKHEYFQEVGGPGQENLFNVVKAYSLYDEEVGYTQGIQFIVGPLLLNMPDEEAFCVLVRLMKSYDLRSHYSPDMPGLQLRLFQFDRLLEELLPGVYMHLLRQGIKSSMYASQWILTMFGYRFPMELVTSVFDLVFAEGVEAIFRFSVAILKRNEEMLCSLEFEQLIAFLRDGLFAAYAPDTDGESQYKAQEYVRDALQIKITPLMLDQFGEEWENLCRIENASTLEIETLRKANQQLTLQVKTLESNLVQINLEHCELVKQVVMSKIDREELEDELVKYKIAFADLAHLQAAEGAGLRHNQNGSFRDWERK